MPRNQPLKLFDGPHQPFEPFWSIKNDASEPEIEFYGYISEYSWFEDDITPLKLKTDLYKAAAGGPVTILLHSGGGDVFAASAIRSILAEYPGRVTVRIDGLCASAATIVATAGDVVKMQDSAYFMIHDPIALAWGNVDQLKSMIDVLRTIKDGILDTYEIRSTVDRDKLAKWMSDETWFTAREAKTYGFIDEVIGGSSSQPASKPADMAVMNCLTSFVNVPAALLATLEPENQPAEPPDVTRLRAEVKVLV